MHKSASRRIPTSQPPPAASLLPTIVLWSAATLLRAQDFTATQIAYSDPADGNAVLLEWTQAAEGEAKILRDQTEIGSVSGAAGENQYTAVNTPLGEHVFAVEDGSGRQLGSQVQTVIAVRDAIKHFNDASLGTCSQSTAGGDCEIIVDVTTGIPVADVYEVFVDGALSLSWEDFRQETLEFATSTAGEHCVTVYAYQAGGPDGEPGRYRGPAVESCCQITCGAQPCAAPAGLLLSQSAYGAGPEANAVIGRWELPGGPYAGGIATFIDGVEKSPLSGGARRAAFTGLAPGVHQLGLQGDCGPESGKSSTSSGSIDLLTSTPHPNPVAGEVACEFIKADDGGKTHATWTNGDPSDFIDVYIDGAPRSFIGTISGGQTTVTVDGTRAADAIVLQFFKLAGGRGYGSEPIVCRPAVAGNAFLRGNTNGDGSVDLSDAVYLLGNLFSGRPAPPCEASAFINDDAAKDISDAIYLLAHLFTGGPPPRGWPGGTPTCEVAPVEDCAAAHESCAG